MNKKMLLAWLLVLTMLLSGCSLIVMDEEVDRNSAVITVGDKVITKAEVLDQVNYNLNYNAYLYSMYGYYYDPTDESVIASMKDSVIQGMIENEVEQQKAKALGLDQLTAEEQAELDQNIETAWQENLDYIALYSLTEEEEALEGEAKDAAILAAAEANGLVKDDIVAAETRTYLAEKLRKSVIADVTIDDGDLNTKLAEKVASAMSTYSSNLSAYGTAVNNGTTVYYRPEGYRMVKQILVQFTDEDQAKMDAIAEKSSEQRTEISSLTSALTGAGFDAETVSAMVAAATVDVATAEAAEDAEVKVDVVTAEANVDAEALTAVVTADAEEGAELPEVTEDVVANVKALAAAQAVKAAYDAMAADAKTAAYAAIADKADEVIARLDAGEDWDAVSAECNDDPGMKGDTDTAKNGYAVCEGFTAFDSAFTAAAMGIENVGDHSAKTEGSYGYYIIQYTSAVEAGAVALDEVRDALHDETLSEKQDTVYSEQLAVWVKEANAKVDRKALDRK